MNKIFQQLINVSILICIFFTCFGLLGLRWPNALPWNDLSAFFRYLGSLFFFLIVTHLLSRTFKFSVRFSGAILFIAIGIFSASLWPIMVTVLLFFSSALVGHNILKMLNLKNITRDDLLLELLIGVGAYGFLVSISSHFSVNFPGVYGVVLLLPIALNQDNALGLVKKIFKNPQEDIGIVYWFDVALIALSGIYLMVALMPEVGFDALTTHLFVPSQLSNRHVWEFDVKNYVWAVMPMMADWIYSIGFMLGGETAARLINLSFIYILCLLARDLVYWAGGIASAGRMAMLLLLTTPISFLEGSSLQVEGVWAAFLLGSLLALLRATNSKEQNEFNIVTFGILFGFALSTKVITLMMAPIFLILIIGAWRNLIRDDLKKTIFLGLGFFLLLSSIPYLNAFIYTGNPVFPFFNKLFQSPLYPIENFRDMRWVAGNSWNILYSITFESGRYQEASPGAPGFQWILLLVPGILILIQKSINKGIVLALIGCAFFALVFESASYLRYTFPALVILISSIALAAQFWIEKSPSISRGLISAAIMLTFALNLLFLNSAAWYGDFQAINLLDKNKLDDYMATRVPERSAVELINNLNIKRTPVAFISMPFGAGIKADALYANWYNKDFYNALAQIKTEEDALAFLLDRSVNFLVLDYQWLGDGKNLKPQRDLIEKVTTQVALFGSISVRKINSDLRFHQELIKNPNFISTEFWTFTPGAEWISSKNEVLVSEANPVYQSVVVRGNREYRNIVNARCAAEQTKGRAQINWSDINGKFLKADIITFDCASEWSDYVMNVIAPPTATIATVYTAGHTQIPLLYKRNSLMQ